MGAVIVRRLLELPIALSGILALVFLALSVTGDPVEMLAPPEATDQDKAELRQALGLDKPFPYQFVLFLLRSARGDFGESFFLRRPALDLVLERLPRSLALAASSITLSIVVGIPLGIAAALYRGTVVDIFVMTLSMLGQTVANFWLALMLIYVFAVRLQWLPVSGMNGVKSIILPSFSLSLWLLALLARMTRSGMLDTMSEDFIRTARAKGLRERSILWRHALRHVSIPLLTLTSISLGWQLGGAVVIESVFAWDGLGSLMLQSVLRRDYPVVLAGVTVLAMIIIGLNLITDVLYQLVDPRVRVAAGRP